MQQPETLKCCERCFSNQYLISLIKKDGEDGDCDFCYSQHVKCIFPSKLTKLFEPILEVFRPSERDTTMPLYFYIGLFWRVFSDTLEEQGEVNHLIDRIRPYEEQSGGEISFLDGYEGDFAEDCWCPKDEYRAYPVWDRFRKSVTHNNRHFVRNMPFFKYLDDISEKAAVEYKPGINIYRGRVSESNLKAEAFAGDKLRPPPPESATAGRANVEGVPVFYGAEDQETVVAELRPWLGATISIARFKVLRKLKLLNFTHLSAYRCPFTDGDPRESVLRIQLMHQIDNAFSTPLSTSDSILGYVPTQFVASYAKHKQFDGIIYQSAMRQNGRNIVIFNHDGAVEEDQIFHLKVKGLEYSTEEYTPKNLIV